jgi:hypothetical protein
VLSGDEFDLADLVRQLIDSALPYVLLCDERAEGSARPVASKGTAPAAARTRSNQQHHGQSQVEDPAFENAQPPRRQLEAERRNDRRVPAVPPTEASALRVPKLRFLRRPQGVAPKDEHAGPFTRLTGDLTDRSELRRAHRGVGHYVPDNVMSNADFEKILDTRTSGSSPAPGCASAATRPRWPRATSRTRAARHALERAASPSTSIATSSRR